MLFGQGTDAVPAAKRIVSSLGALDEDVGDAQRMERLFSKHTGTSGLFSDNGRVLYNNLEAAQDHLPSSIGAFFSKHKDLTDDDLRSIEGLAAAGMPVTQEQYRALRSDIGSGRSVARSVGSLVFGDKPLQVLQQRYTQGGILGPGGLVFGDLAPPPALTRHASRFSDAVGKREWGRAGRYGMSAGVTGLGYAGGTLTGYVMPGMAAYEAWQLAPEAGESRVNAATASLLNSAGSAMVSPLGWGAMPLYGPISSLAHRTAGAPELGELQARVAQRRGLVAPGADPRSLLTTPQGPGKT